VPQPIVTVGIPTRNRPRGLLQTLTDISRQSYRNLEILVSDNASSDTENRRTAHAFESTDDRVVVFAQERDLGPVKNFDFLLGKAIGTYFMWAADDDRWESWFIERCVDALERHGPSAAAAVTEAQYFTDDGVCDFFSEGKAFYGRTGLGRLERLQLLLDHNYGNLFYSVFRREALLLDGAPLISALGFRSLNEIPILLQVAARGDWIVLPEAGIKKQTRLPTYRQARWEMEGGRLSKECRATSLRSVRSLYKYHAEALKEIGQSIGCLPLSGEEKKQLKARAARNIWRHFAYVAIGYKLS
jgi:glycosyltransferase involved in cell wall biosynthesis